MPAAPAHIGKYRIDGTLGSGAMGVVYRAFDPDIGRPVALKTVRKELFDALGRDLLLARFRHEAQAAGRLTHPHIVTVYEYGEDADTAYIAMEFVSGAALSEQLLTEAPGNVDRALACIGQLLRALSYAHANGVVHRDIKPANLLFTPDGQLKVTDFGIARLDASTLTHTGSIIGTPSYMSPEQIRGDAVDGRSDIFSAAIVLYQLLTGVRPFAGSATTVMQKILTAIPPSPSVLNTALGPAFDAVLVTAMAKAPEHRYATAQDFLMALEQVGGGDDTVVAAAMPDQAARDLAEQTLLPMVGPIAKVLVRRAAARAGSAQEFRRLLSEQLTTQAERDAFLRTLAG